LKFSFWELTLISELSIFLQELFLFEENGFFSILSHVVEFLMNQSDLFVRQTVGLSVDKTLD
jgi:hypothetical protein